jgi:hypothetical protein
MHLDVLDVPSINTVITLKQHAEAVFDDYNVRKIQEKVCHMHNMRLIN